MRQVLRGMCAGAALVWALAGAVAGQDSQVVIESLAGDARVVGQLVGFEDGVYAVRTKFGVLHFPSNVVNCKGAACPRIGPPAITVGVASPALAGALERLLEEFAAGRGADIRAVEAPQEARRFELRQADETIAEITLQPVAEPGPSAAAGWPGSGPDIALVTRPRGAPGQDRRLATDAVVALVHGDNPVRALSPDELAGVLDGSISDWSQLGGPDGAIEIILPAADTLAGGALAAVLGEASDGGETVAVPEIPARVATAPGAIGLTLWSARGAGGRALDLVGPCDTPVPADEFAIASGQYPLLADMSLSAGAGDLPEIAGDFADFLASDAARARLEEAGLPPRRPPVVLPVGRQGDHLARSLAAARGDAERAQIQALATDLVGARQLSTVYHFGSNAARREPEHARLTAALAGYLSDLDPERTEVFLHGYADALETSRRRVGLSRLRAEYVRRLIGEAAPAFVPRLRAAGFEGLAPRGCNREADGRSLNRRVEVWVRAAD